MGALILVGLLKGLLRITRGRACELMLLKNPPRRAKDGLLASVSNIAGSDDVISPVFGSYRFRDEHEVQVKSLGSSGGEESLVEQ
jgi:hypothetical protein